MKSLALFIDKWYIVGAICSDGNIRQISLPNKEDRIWLFFHEDVDNNTISYGKGYKSHFWNRENHYYGDVFSRITDPDATFIRFRHRQVLKDIFKSSKIFDDLRSSMEESGTISVYLSFSKDISLAARLLFMEQLKLADFHIEENVARIEHLALEYALKRNILTDDGSYLTLNASNENLYYAVYQKSGSLFVRKEEAAMCGMGTDLRARCLIEYVIDNINRTERFLKDEDEREREYLRSAQFVDDWIVRLAAAPRPNVPVQITDITLSIDPYKTYQVQVRKKEIDEKTSTIVRNVVEDIVSFIANANVRQEQLCGVLFLGDTLTNQQFSEQLLSYYNIPSSRIIRYMDKDLPSLVCAYGFMDCSQFKDLEAKFAQNAEVELLRIKNLKKEEEDKKRAEEEAAEAAKREEERKGEERKYKDAMDNGFRCEQDRDYDNMVDYFKIAHELRPNDAEAKQKYDEALRLQAEASVLMNNYKEKIREAKDAYEKREWERASQKAEEALSAYPKSEEAKKIRSEANRIIKQSKDFERYIDRADSFIAQKLYEVALEELSKAHLTGLDDNAVKEREIKIRNLQKEEKKKIEALISEISKFEGMGQYDDAIQCCNDLIELDLANKKKWTSRIADIRALQERRMEETRRVKKLERDIQSAQWDEDWNKLETICKEYLEIKNDENVEKILRKTSEKLGEERENDAIKQNIADINDLIVHAEFKLAKEKLRALEKKELSTEIRRQTRDLWKTLFAREDEAETTRKVRRNPSCIQEGNNPSEPKRESAPHRPIDGFREPTEKEQKNDDFFDEPLQRRTQKSKRNGATNPQKEDEFFDDAYSYTPKRSDRNTSAKGQMTNDDFNF